MLAGSTYTCQTYRRFQSLPKKVIDCGIESLQPLCCETRDWQTRPVQRMPAELAAGALYDGGSLQKDGIRNVLITF